MYMKLKYPPFENKLVLKCIHNTHKHWRLQFWHSLFVSGIAFSLPTFASHTLAAWRVCIWKCFFLFSFSITFCVSCACFVLNPPPIYAWELCESNWRHGVRVRSFQKELFTVHIHIYVLFVSSLANDNEQFTIQLDMQKTSDNALFSCTTQTRCRSKIEQVRIKHEWGKGNNNIWIETEKWLNNMENAQNKGRKKAQWKKPRNKRLYLLTFNLFELITWERMKNKQ